MNTKDLMHLGVPEGEAMRLAHGFIRNFVAAGNGSSFKDRRDHDVMDDDWSVSAASLRLRDKAWSRLGTS